MTPQDKTPIRALIEAVEAGAINWYGWTDRDVALPTGLWKVARAADRGSLDAALALHEALLPGWKWHTGYTQGVPTPYSSVWPEGMEWENVDALGISPARAWLLAILRAVEANQ